MNYKPFTNDNTKEIIKEIKDSLPNINKSILSIDTLDLCHLIGEIERLNNIIKELEKYLDTLHWFRLGKKEENGNMEYFYASVSNFYEDTKSILKGSE